MHRCKKTMKMRKTIQVTKFISQSGFSLKLIIFSNREFDQSENERFVIIFSAFSLGNFAFTECHSLFVATNRFRLHSVGKTK